MTAVATPETPALDLKQAQRLTERARLVATTLMEAREKLATILAEAEKGRVWEALGMPNIQAWAEFTFSSTPLAQLPREDRRVIVKQLAEEGYGTRPIASIVGTDHSTVSRDMKAVSVASATDGPRKVHGADGITRTFQPKPEPGTVDHESGQIAQRKPNRRPIVDQYRDAAYELRKAVERIERLHADDRFNRNASVIGEMFYSDIRRSSKKLLDPLIDLEDATKTNA